MGESDSVVQTLAESAAVCVRVRRSLVVDFYIEYSLAPPEKGIRIVPVLFHPTQAGWCC